MKFSGRFFPSGRTFPCIRTDFVSIYYLSSSLHVRFYRDEQRANLERMWYEPGTKETRLKCMWYEPGTKETRLKCGLVPILHRTYMIIRYIRCRKRRIPALFPVKCVLVVCLMFLLFGKEVFLLLFFLWFAMIPGNTSPDFAPGRRTDKGKVAGLTSSAISVESGLWSNL